MNSMKHFLILFCSVCSLVLNAQCPTVSPNGQDTCRIGSGTAVLGASGSTGNYSWYDASSGGNYLGSGSSFITPSISSTTDFFVAAADTTRGLNFDGANDYVAISNFNYAGSGFAEVTVECWIRTTDGTDQMIASFDRSEYWRLEINGSGAGTGQVGWDVMTDAGQMDFGSTSTVNDGEWHHIAAVYDNGTASIYIDGVLDASTTQGTSFGTGITRFGFVSAGSEATFFNGTNTPFWPFNGDIEDFRIWSTARTAIEIQENMSRCLAGTEPGLEVYYPMEEGAGTLVGDLSSGNDGTMFNMNPATDWIEADHDYFCPSCESPRTIVTATVSTGPALDLGPDYFSYCGFTSLTLDAGVGYTNYLWNTTETTSLINVSVPGEYYVQVDNGAGCFDFDTIQIAESPLGGIPSSPSANDTCRIGAGSVGLTASGSTGNYLWYDAPTAGTFLDTGSVYNTPVLGSSTTYYVSAIEDNNGLNFDGANDYVALNSFYASSGITEVTVEAWIRTTKTEAQIIASYDRSDYWRLGVSSTGGSTGQVTWNLGTNAGILDMASSSTVNDGNWHHVAGVYDNGTATIYVDGVADGTATLGTSIGTGTTRYGFIATGSETSSFNGTQTISRFQGDIDEVRIWNVARTGAEISASMSACLNGDVEGLFAYYSAEDAAGTTLTDVFSGQDGTLFNMAPASDWIESDYIFTCEACESPRTAVTVTIGAGSSLDLGPDQSLTCSPSATLDAGGSYTSYLWSTTETSSSITVSTPGIYTVLVEDGAGCNDADTIFVQGADGSSQTALNFDGSNDYVAIPNFFYASNSIPEVTVEAWIRTSSGGDQIIASYDRSEYWRFGINGDGAGTGQVSWNVRTDAGILDMGSSTRVDDGLWHHVAGVYDNGVASIYIDGVLDAQVTSGSVMGSGLTRFGFISSGSEATTFNAVRTPANEMLGDIDQLRIWSVAKTADQIRRDMCLTSPVDGTGLEMSFSFNDGSGTMVTESVAGNDGTMFNMAPASDWVTSGAAIGDQSAYLYTGSWGGATISLTSCAGDQVEISNVSGSPSGVHLYVVETDPNSTTGITGFTSGNYYYGVFQTDDNSESFDVTYTYTGHPLVSAANESSLILLDRTDNTDLNWIDNGSTINVGTDEISASSAGRREFIIDANEYVWTGASNTNWAIAANWLPTTVPPSGANIRIPNVTNQPVLDSDRQIGSFNLESEATADLNGFVLSVYDNILHDGVLSFNGGTLNLNGTTTDQNLILNSDMIAENIISANPGNVSISSGVLSVEGSLDVTAGTFNTNDSLIIVSNALGTGRIGEITGTEISGEIEMQRHIDAGETYWRYFSSAVNGATIAQYNDDFVTAGYPGSLYPSFSTGGAPWPSVYTYDETLGPGLGYLPATSASQIIQVGQGLEVWCGDTITGTTPFVVDLRGPVNQGNIALPVSYTFTGTPAEDGYCLVGNPYPSTIDWDAAGWTKFNMNDAVYIKNPDTEFFATYVAGTGTNGGSRFIASQQAFYVLANNEFPGSPVLDISESCKASNDPTFFRAGDYYDPGCKIAINGLGLRDECVVRHGDDALDTFEGNKDALKLWGGWGEHPQISLLNGENKDFTIHTFDFDNEEWSIPLRVIVFETGMYSMDFENVALLDVPCVKLEDTYTGIIYDVEDGLGLEFEMYDTTWAPRFILHLGKEYNTEITHVSCNSSNDGMIELDLDLPTVDFSLTTSEGTESITGVDGDPLILSGLESDIYSIEVPGLTNLCGTNTFDLVVNEPSILNVTGSVSHDDGSGVGVISAEVLGGTAPYSYEWDFGATTATVMDLSPGFYIVRVTDANGCQGEETFEVVYALGVEDYVLETKVWLDQTQEFIIIQNGSNMNTLGIYSIDGKLIHALNATSNSGSTQIPVPNSLENGVYFLRNSDNSIALKFVLSK